MPEKNVLNFQERSWAYEAHLFILACLSSNSPYLLGFIWKKSVYSVFSRYKIQWGRHGDEQHKMNMKET